MQTKDSKLINGTGIVLLYMAPVASVGCYCLLNHETIIDAFSNIALALILAGMFFTLLHVNQKYLYLKIAHKLLYFTSFFISFLFLGTATGFPVGIMWMMAVVIAALDCGIELAAATHVALMIQYASLLLPLDNGFYRFSGYILLGMVVALLFSLLNGMDSVFYLTLILVACDGILQLVVYRFSLSLLKENQVPAVIEITSVLILVLAGIIYLKKYGAKQGGAVTDMEDSAEAFGQAPEIVAEEQTKEPGQKEEMQLQMLISPDYELVLRLQGYSEELLKHSKRISVLSEKAAEAIGGNTMLAKAGGLYHEIGRMEDEDDYIEAGTRIGQAYNFPEGLLAVMRQHSTGFELPKSVEAAVVMLSDCIISTSEFLVKSGKREMLSDEQLVNSIFQNRLEKGNLEFAGMTLEQLQDLQEFYINNAFSDI